MSDNTKPTIPTTEADCLAAAVQAIDLVYKVAIHFRDVAQPVGQGGAVLAGAARVFADLAKRASELPDAELARWSGVAAMVATNAASMIRAALLERAARAEANGEAPVVIFSADGITPIRSGNANLVDLGGRPINGAKR